MKMYHKEGYASYEHRITSCEADLGALNSHFYYAVSHA